MIGITIAMVSIYDFILAVNDFLIKNCSDSGKRKKLNKLD